jgi:vacuolar-type H+-ATPase subunit I/STV1
VRTALLERDEALRKEREDKATVWVAAVEFERELASAQTQLQQDRTTLEGRGLGRARPRRRPRRTNS